MIRRGHASWLLPGALLVLAVVVALRAATLLRYDIWFDELYSVYAAAGDLAGVRRATAPADAPADTPA